MRARLAGGAAKPRRAKEQRAATALASNIKDFQLVEERRTRIAEAATREFLEKGFHAAVTSDIARRAGLSQGTLYNHVRSKSDMLYLVCDEAVTHYQRGVREAIEGTTDPQERLRRAIEASVSLQYRFRDNIQIVLRDGYALDEKARAAVRAKVGEFFDLMRELVDAAIGKGGDPVTNLVLSEAITYLPTMFAMRRWRLPRDVPPERLVAAMTGCLLAMAAACAKR
jgi:TetR/AcrR family transcriptional regulator, cholesterol catabolism regulator